MTILTTDLKTLSAQDALRSILTKPNSMLLLRQSGAVKIGEVIRYTITYTPSDDRILPAPATLHLRVKNTSAIALRAAFMHGPYTLSAAAYPAGFRADRKWEYSKSLGVPEFEPNLKAGGSWDYVLHVPENLRVEAGIKNGKDSKEVAIEADNNDSRSISWIVEVASQVIFSNSAAVHYEILLGRDESCLSLSLTSGLTGDGKSVAGHVSDHQQSAGAIEGKHNAQVKGVFTKAIRIKVEDTASLWNTPRLPEWDNKGTERLKGNLASQRDEAVESVVQHGEEHLHGQMKQKQVHLVVLTHGLHSNLGADMLYLKESIDATVRQAKIDARSRRRKRREEEREIFARVQMTPKAHLQEERAEIPTETKARKQRREDDLDESEDEEEVIVRGFSGNAVRTERGIKYLGKRLARYVLAMTHFDQQSRPIMKRATEEFLYSRKADQIPSNTLVESPQYSTNPQKPDDCRKRAYKITSISFVAHSLGGLVQTYAVAYIQKHCPEFFDKIRPVNFIALASPFLGLSNENPLYVKFALDFGLVGRTGQDLGLTWRAPTITRSGWNAIVGGISESAQKRVDGGYRHPESKPLLRILPTGPAHLALKKFRNRTVYSNIVNDGIVPLRTSCLLFLDWKGLGRVEKARRENGLVGTIAGWGWAELTGANSTSPSRKSFFSPTPSSTDENTADDMPTKRSHDEQVPQPPLSAIADDDAGSIKSISRPHTAGSSSSCENSTGTGPLASILKFFQQSNAIKSPKKYDHVYRRSQTLPTNDDSPLSTTQTITVTSPTSPSPTQPGNGKATTGDTEYNDPYNLSAPPKTTLFESAGDLLKPPLPTVEYIIDPSKRPRTIFHDRVYHPSDIPPLPLKKRPSRMLRHYSPSNVIQNINNTIPSCSSTSSSVPQTPSDHPSKDYNGVTYSRPENPPLLVIDNSTMRVEEKIARAYHRDLSWRKVLVRLEPDAHNNIIVRRMFANAYGWPVIKHLCDAHFSDSVVAGTRDDSIANKVGEKGMSEGPVKGDAETKEGACIRKFHASDRTDSENIEATDEIGPIRPLSPTSRQISAGSTSPGASKLTLRTVYDGESDAAWSEKDWACSEADSEDEDIINGGEETAKRPWASWTNAITGKGAWAATGKGKERAEEEGAETGTPTDIDDLEAFLGKKSTGEVAHAAAGA